MDNVNEMMSLLALRLEDAAKVVFTDSLKKTTLGNGIMKLCQMIRIEYLTELQNLDDDGGSGHEATNGILALSTLNGGLGVLRGTEGIFKVRIHDGLFATEYDLEDLKKKENKFLKGSVENPIYYLFNNNIYVDNGETSPLIDVYCLKAPSPLLYKFTYTEVGGEVNQIQGDIDQGLSSVLDYYKYAVIYDIAQKRYYTVDGYSTDRKFTISPNYAGSDPGTFYFLTHDFDLQNLEGIICELNSSLLEIVVTLAEGECWGMDNDSARRKSALEAAFNEINILNERYTKPEGIGTRGRK